MPQCSLSSTMTCANVLQYTVLQLSPSCTGAPGTCHSGAVSPSTWLCSWTCSWPSSTPWRVSAEVSLLKSSNFTFVYPFNTGRATGCSMELVVFVCVYALWLTQWVWLISHRKLEWVAQTWPGVGQEAHRTYCALPETCMATLKKKINWAMAC